MQQKHFLFFIVLCLSFLLPGEAFSQQHKGNNEIAPIDSVIYAYYQKCLERRTDSIVLLMCDTLFQMSKQKADKRMQAVALSTKLEYYYYGNHLHKEDSVIAWTNRVKAFAKETNQPKYYYFSWGNRLILYYILKKNYHLALVEAEKMLKEAESENDLVGIATCYNCLSSIYNNRNLMEQALDYALKEIDLFEKYHLERYNIASQYGSVAGYLIILKQYDKVLYYLEKQKEMVKTPLQHFTNYKQYLKYYLAIDNIDEATKYLNNAREIFTVNKKVLNLYLYELYLTEYSYYYHIKNYNKALEALELWKKEIDLKKRASEESDYLNFKANIYWQQNRKVEAASLYKAYIDLLNKEKEEDEQATTAQFATLLNLQKLNAEKLELEDLTRKRKLQNTYITITFLSILLLVVTLFLYRQNKINKQLERSKKKLDKRNQTLLKAKEELSKARDIAEKNNHLKTVFIQNMSHEIRTPLNAIVGFSAVLSSMFGDENKEIKQYASLIEKNSQILLKLVDDILNISILDDPALTFPQAPMDVNLYCSYNLEQFRNSVPPGIELQFIPTYESLIVESSAQHVSLVINQLLSNAIKFTQEGGIELTYSYNKQQQELTVTITDTGKGIPINQHDKVFERFVKLDQFTQGTGLGLPICKVVSRRLGGNITIDKEYTSGTRFHFTLSAPVVVS